MQSLALETAPPSAQELTITRGYARVSASGNFNSRPAQAELSNLIATALTSSSTLVAEAPTGTGKTVAYLMGALAAQQVTQRSIVVATATKALQQQLIANDLPRLFAAGLLSPQDVALAKGKSNYLCMRNAEDIEQTAISVSSDPESYLSDSFLRVSEAEVTRALGAYIDGSWNGDFDQYEGAMSIDSKRVIAVSSDTCTRKKCEHFKECAYYKAKTAIQKKRVVVTNHDLLLQDLRLVADGFEPALDLPEYHLVVDEAHHLPQKAIQMGTHDGLLSQLMQTLPKLQGLQRLITGSPELVRLLSSGGVTESAFDKAECHTVLRDLIFGLMDIPVDEDSGLMRFTGGELPVTIADLVTPTVAPLTALTENLTKLNSVLKDAEGLTAPLAEKAREMQKRALDVKRLSEAILLCIAELQGSRQHAKWVFRKENTVSLHCAPLEGAQVLNKLLWTAARVKGVVLISATLQDVDGFTRYRRKVGAPASAVAKVLPHTFEYAKSELVVVGMAHTPKPAERRMFLPELRAKLSERISLTDGTLVLFPSWALLREVAPTLKTKFGPDVVKVQGEQTVKLLVQAHKAAVERGYPSILVGVATMSEGLDLPGNYCTHVCIVALPFAVPSDPVEQELAERLGSRYFSERSLPDAMGKLNQQVGRLLRRESDQGRVSVFDRRLSATSYGRQMLKALPPFKVTVEPVTPG
jgi:ATP-dependent DNA helicase DinG